MKAGNLKIVEYGKGTRFKKGNKGRPKGAKGKITEQFLKDMLTAWETGGPSVIADVMENKPDVFLRVVASLVPKDMNLTPVNHAEALTDNEARERIAELAEQLEGLGIIVKTIDPKTGGGH